MWKSRAAYIGLIILSGVLLFLCAKPFFLCVCLGLILLAVILFLCLKRDAETIRVTMEMPHGSRVGREQPLRFRVEHPEKLLATGAVLVELQIRNVMFHTIDKKRYLIPMEDDREYYEVMLPVPLCGELRVHCGGIRVRDMLKLFLLRAESFEDLSTTCYPNRIDIQTEMAGDIVGISRDEGFIQNRKGSDPSEMFDIREYVPGDDIRSIHWKLSSKTDQLILRQASDPSHYDVAILPDFGLRQWDAALKEEEACAAVAMGVAIGEQLVERGLAFCMVIPTDSGLQIREIFNERQLRQAQSAWLGYRIQENGGNGVQFFRMQHLEEQFTRLVILSAGKYEQDLNGLDSRIGITILSAIKDLEAVHNEESGHCIITEYPTQAKPGSTYHIIC